MRDWKNRRPQEVYLYSQGAACQPNSGCEDCLRMFEIVLSFEGKSKHGVPLLFLYTHTHVQYIYIVYDIISICYGYDIYIYGTGYRTVYLYWHWFTSANSLEMTQKYTTNLCNSKLGASCFHARLVSTQRAWRWWTPRELCDGLGGMFEQWSMETEGPIPVCLMCLWDVIVIDSVVFYS